MIYVIGSGPSGVSIAMSLLQQGLEVTILDVGLTIEKNKQKSVPNKLKRKLSYGSLFPYKEEGIKEFSASYAKGGLSNVWGAAISPYREEDIKDWPINIKNLNSSYKKVQSIMSIAGHTKSPKNYCKLFRTNLLKIKPSKEALAIYSFIDKNSNSLNNEINIDFSRLAFSIPQNSNTLCNLCGKCLEGCPDELIYNSASTLKLLKKYQKFNYLDNIEVLSLSESKNEVNIYSRDLKSQTTRKFRGDRVYLASGVLSTAKIILSSFEKKAISIPIKSSQYFIFPGLITEKLIKKNFEDNHAMSQLFLKVKSSSLIGSPAHLQMYTKSEFLFENFKLRINFIPDFLFNFFKKYFNQVLIFQGYLHSNEVSPRYLNYNIDSETKKSSLSISNSKYDYTTKKIVRKILFKLYKNKSKIGFLTIPFLYSIGNFGYGFHVGGTFPMAKTPKGSQSDIFGRPYNKKRIHIVDASIFPSIPASTITYSVMANSFRIGESYNDYSHDK